MIVKNNHSDSPIAISVEPLPEFAEKASRTLKGTIVAPSRCCNAADKKPILINGITVKAVKSA